MFLALCMIVTMLPVTALAEEIHTTIGTSGEIISFAPLTETAKAVSPGTSIEDLELPETLTATVRTAVPAAENPTQDSGSPETATLTTAAEPEWKETTVDIPVRWASPDYDMNTEGAYVFTPVIEGYTVSADLPEITVIVGTSAIAARGMQPQAIAAGDVAGIDSMGYATLQEAVDAVTEGQTIKLLEDITLSTVVTISHNNNFTLDLNGKTISVPYTVLTAIQHAGGGTLTIQDSGGGKIAHISSNGTASTIKITNDGSVTLLSGTIESSMAAIDNKGAGDVTVSGGTVKSNGPGMTINSTGSGDVMISGGTVESTNIAGIAIARGYGSSGKIILSGTAAITAVYRGIWLYGSVSSEPVLEITGGTLTHTGATGYVIDVITTNTILVQGGTLQSTQKSVIGNISGANFTTVKINIPAGGSAIFKGGEKVLADGYALTLENAGVSVASENFDGTNPVSAYNAANIATYKYLEFKPAAGASEQFNLTPGGTYYFDLSGEKDNVGTINTALPDTTLHYVPFTYAGTVNAYSLTSAMATTEAYATANKSDRSLFVGDYNIGVSVNWDSLNTASLIFGKPFDVHYKLRSLSAGSSRTGSASDGSDHIGQPSTNEWDQILGKSGSTDNTTGWIKNWSSIYSWGQDTSELFFYNRAVRGSSLGVFWFYTNSINSYPDCGFRPALEVLDPAALTSDGLKAVTLNLNGGTFNSESTISIICAGNNFKAPSGEGLTAPYGKTFDGWKDTSGSETYAAGAEVPNTVTGLTAQWVASDTTAPVVTSVSVPANGTYSAGSNLEFTVNFDENVTVSTAGGIPYIALMVGSQTKLATYVSGSGTTALVFRYMISAGDSDSDGITIGSLILNGGTIQDTAGNNVILTLNGVGNTSGVLVNTANASLSPTSATFDLNPNGANYKDIDVTLTQGGYYLSQIKNGGVPLLSISDYIPNGGGSYTLKKSYLSSLGEGSASITFQMSGGTSPTLALTIEDT